MQTLATTSLKTKFGLLLCGEPWSRKSGLAMQFPDPWLLDADNNLGRLLKLPFMRYKRFWFDTPDNDPTGKPLPEHKKWERILQLSQAAYEAPEPQILVYDSLTRIGHYLERYIVSQVSSTKDLVVGGDKQMTQQHWGAYKTLMLRLITELRGGNKPVIFIAHRKVDKDDVLGTLFYKPMIGGQLADSAGGLFTDVWNCSATPVVPGPSNGNTGVEYWIETVPQPRQVQLGTSLDLPPKFQMDWKGIIEPALKKAGVL